MKKSTKIKGLILGLLGLFGYALLLGFSTGNPIGPSRAYASENPVGTEQVELQIDGMTCRKCVKPMQKALLALPGVTAAKVSYADANAEVEFEKGKVSDDQLIQAVEDESSFFYTYKAKVTSRK